jgi:hypothetical protein
LTDAPADRIDTARAGAASTINGEPVQLVGLPMQARGQYADQTNRGVPFHKIAGLTFLLVIFVKPILLSDLSGPLGHFVATDIQQEIRREVSEERREFLNMSENSNTRRRHGLRYCTK